MILSLSQHITEGYRVVDTPWTELGTLICSHLNYSPSTFESGYRDSAHFVGGNEVVVLDIDEGWGLSEARAWLTAHQLRALVATTRSHQKAKNGVVCDRFRVLVPLNEPFIGTVKEFSYMMRGIHHFFEDKPDPAAKDCARFYYGNPEGEYWYSHGTRTLSGPLFTRLGQPETQRLAARGTGDYRALIDYFIREGVEGRRNNILFRAYKCFTEMGVDASGMVRYINSQLAVPLPEDEIKAICRLS